MLRSLVRIFCCTLHWLRAHCFATVSLINLLLIAAGASPCLFLCRFVHWRSALLLDSGTSRMGKTTHLFPNCAFAPKQKKTVGHTQNSARSRYECIATKIHFKNFNKLIFSDRKFSRRCVTIYASFLLHLGWHNRMNEYVNSTLRKCGRRDNMPSSSLIGTNRLLCEHSNGNSKTR